MCNLMFSIKFQKFLTIISCLSFRDSYYAYFGTLDGVLQISEACHFSTFFFSTYSLDQVISISFSSGSLIISSASSKLFFNLSSEIFILVIVISKSRISIRVFCFCFFTVYFLLIFSTQQTLFSSFTLSTCLDMFSFSSLYIFIIVDLKSLVNPIFGFPLVQFMPNAFFPVYEPYLPASLLYHNLEWNLDV